MGKSDRLYFRGASKSLQMVTEAMKLKYSCSLEEIMTNVDNILITRDTTLQIKILLIKAMVFPVLMYECESWTLQKAEH